MATIVFLVFVSLAGACLAQPAPFHGVAAGYTLSIPAEWTQIPPDFVTKSMDSLQSAEAKGKYTFDAGFQSKDHKQWFEYPYVLVQVMPYKGYGVTRQIREDEFEKLVKALTGLDPDKALDKALNSDARSLVSKPALGRPQLDRARRRYVMSLDMNVAGIGKVHGTMAGYFGHDAIVQVAGYARADEWERHAPAIQTIVDSFQFDANQAYRPSESIISGMMGPVVTFGILGGVIGSIIYVVVRARRFTPQGPGRVG